MCDQGIEHPDGIRLEKGWSQPAFATRPHQREEMRTFGHHLSVKNGAQKSKSHCGTSLSENGIRNCRF